MSSRDGTPRTDDRTAYNTRKTESPPLAIGPRRAHYTFSASLPVIHLTFVSIVQGIVLVLLFQSFPLPNKADASNLPVFLGNQYGYLPYLVSGSLVIVIWKQFVQAALFYVWPLSSVQLVLMLLISLAEAVAFREITHFNAWLVGLGATGLIGGFIRLNNVRLYEEADYEQPGAVIVDRRIEMVDGLLYILLGFLVGAGGVFLHYWGGLAVSVDSARWVVLGILVLIMAEVFWLDHQHWLELTENAIRDSDLETTRQGGLRYKSAAPAK